MSTVAAYLCLAFGLAALGAGIVGWLAPIPDSALRFTARFYAWAAVWVLFVVWLWDDVRHGRWLLFVGSSIVAVYASDRAAHWWKRTEARRAEARAWKLVNRR